MTVLSHCLATLNNFEKKEQYPRNEAQHLFCFNDFVNVRTINKPPIEIRNYVGTVQSVFVSIQTSKGNDSNTRNVQKEVRHFGYFDTNDLCAGLIVSLDEKHLLIFFC